MLVTFVTGSIHCFSVFLVPLENRLGLPRADISLFYSFALIFLTLSVLFGYLVYDRVRPALMIIISCTAAGMGLLISAFANSWWTMFTGYSLLFGVANGFAYGYVLQLGGRALQSHKGFAMAAVTAAYAVGSVCFSLILAKVIEHTSLTMALLALAGIIIVGGNLAALGVKTTRAKYMIDESSCDPQPATIPALRLIVPLWFAYGCSVFAGLMAIGHAAGIVQSLGGNYNIAIWGAVFIGIGSSLGGFFIGAVISRENMHKCLLRLPLISALFLGALFFTQSLVWSIVFLFFVGFSYGAVISVYPFAISEFFGPALGPKVYGCVFTAWGFAGLAGPWTAGKLFDISGEYSTTLLIACVIAVLSTLIYNHTKNRLTNQPDQQSALTSQT